MADGMEKYVTDRKISEVILSPNVNETFPYKSSFMCSGGGGVFVIDI